MFEHILLAVDGSPLSKLALRKTLPLAKRLGARVTALRVYPDYQLHGQFNHLDYVPVDTAAIADAAKKETTRYLWCIVDEALASNVPCDVVCQAGAHPYEVIIRTAEESGCDLIAMASHGRRGIQALLIGSETQKVLTHSKIPVLVFR